jgi:hypothetical protein
VGAYLDRGADWEVIGDLLRDAYMLTAPKKLAASALTSPRPARRGAK